MSIKDKIGELPSSPGVYLMKDSLGNIIYVGKSKNLKCRVSSYFINSKSHSPKVVKLVQNLKDFEYILTDTEFEAFMLECKLIKEIKPRYNRQMKSSMSYSYIHILNKDKYPDILISDEYIKDEESLCFGPYTSKNTVEKAIQGIKEYFKILCNNKSRKASTCLNYSLDLCIGMCLDDEPSEEYLVVFSKIQELFIGTDKSILHGMEQVMEHASEKFDFETAAKYRDYLSAINHLLNKANVIDFAYENKNIVLVQNLYDDTIKFFLISGNKILFQEKYNLSNINFQVLKSNILLYFKNTDSIEIGKDEIDEAQIIYSYLKNKSNNCKYIVIQEEWLKNRNNTQIDEELKKIL